jgi:hypothetical protein
MLPFCGSATRSVYSPWICHCQTVISCLLSPIIFIFFLLTHPDLSPHPFCLDSQTPTPTRVAVNTAVCINRCACTNLFSNTLPARPFVFRFVSAESTFELGIPLPCPIYLLPVDCTSITGIWLGCHLDSCCRQCRDSAL